MKFGDNGHSYGSSSFKVTVFPLGLGSMVVVGFGNGVGVRTESSWVVTREAG